MNKKISYICNIKYYKSIFDRRYLQAVMFRVTMEKIWTRLVWEKCTIFIFYYNHLNFTVNLFYKNNKVINYWSTFCVLIYYIVYSFNI